MSPQQSRSLLVQLGASSTIPLPHTRGSAARRSALMQPASPAEMKKALEISNERLVTAAYAVMAAQGSAMHLTDFFVLGAAKRALSLSTSIFMLIDEEQALAAVTLARPHLDTLLRLHSLELVTNVTEHVRAIIGGERLNKRKDRNGQ